MTIFCTMLNDMESTVIKVAADITERCGIYWWLQWEKRQASCILQYLSSFDMGKNVSLIICPETVLIKR